MANQASDRVNALARGLRVLAALNDLTGASVGDLARASGVPKTTVIRILRTLVQEGYAAQDDAQSYRVTARVAELARGLVGADERKKLIQPILDGLADLKWPVEFLALEGLSIATTQDNRDRVPVRLALFERRRFPIMESAAGIACLAAMPEAERETAMRAGASGKALAAGRRAVARALERGYAERELTDLHPDMRAVAVAVGGERPFGALTLILFHDMVAASALERRIVPRLKAAAREIAAAVATTKTPG